MVYQPAYDKKGLRVYIAEKIIEALIRSFPQETYVALKNIME
jgi:hypothetical protein